MFCVKCLFQYQEIWSKTRLFGTGKYSKPGRTLYFHFIFLSPLSRKLTNSLSLAVDDSLTCYSLSGEETALHCLLTKLDECYGFLVGGVLSPLGLTAEEAAVSDITSLWNEEIVDIICTIYGGMCYCFLTHFYPVDFYPYELGESMYHFKVGTSTHILSVL